MPAHVHGGRANHAHGHARAGKQDVGHTVGEGRQYVCASHTHTGHGSHGRGTVCGKNGEYAYPDQRTDYSAVANSINNSNDDDNSDINDHNDVGNGKRKLEGNIDSGPRINNHRSCSASSSNNNQARVKYHDSRSANSKSALWTQSEVVSVSTIEIGQNLTSRFIVRGTITQLFGVY
jgi:hypothetical protein